MMKNIAEVHGKFNSFAAVAAAIGMKRSKTKSEKARKCPECGMELRQVGGTNVWMCDFSTIEEAELKKNGKVTPVYVLKKCLHREIDPV